MEYSRSFIGVNHSPSTRPEVLFSWNIVAEVDSQNYKQHRAEHCEKAWGFPIFTIFFNPGPKHPAKSIRLFGTDGLMYWRLSIGWFACGLRLQEFEVWWLRAEWAQIGSEPPQSARNIMLWLCDTGGCNPLTQSDGWIEDCRNTTLRNRTLPIALFPLEKESKFNNIRLG